MSSRAPFNSSARLVFSNHRCPALTGLLRRPHSRHRLNHDGRLGAYGESLLDVGTFGWGLGTKPRPCDFPVPPAAHSSCYGLVGAGQVALA